ncbi:MAG TPA: DUF2804 domain-containing protein [Candidatus Hydrogenedentes bacterium]|nr:DUF2804 domain-containing protein [Candidatus Hydrogenedentota bacterium]
MPLTIQETPPSIVEGGRLCTGAFRVPFRRMNFMDAPGLGGPLRRIRLKEWIGFGISHPEWHITTFLLDAKITASALFQAFHRGTNDSVKHVQARIGGTWRLPETMWNGRCEFTKSGFRIACHHHLEAGAHHITVEAAATRNMPAVEADITLTEDMSRVPPLVVSLPVGERNSLYTHKALMPASGTLRIGADEITLDPARDIAILDEHRSFLPYRTTWRWCTFAGYDTQGRLVGLNFGDHDYIPDPDHWTENCIWAGNTLSMLGAGELVYDRTGPMKPWHIHDRQGRVDVRFFPEAKKSERHNLVLLRMNYFQCHGHFEGVVIDAAGEKIPVDGFYGVAEMMDAHF